MFLRISYEINLVKLWYIEDINYLKTRQTENIKKVNFNLEVNKIEYNFYELNWNPRGVDSLLYTNNSRLHVNQLLRNGTLKHFLVFQESFFFFLTK